MLDTSFHQGRSLHPDAIGSGLRFVASVSLGQNTQELENLLKLCAPLQAMGFPVLVLDGSTAETTLAPGLQTLLAQAPWSCEQLPFAQEGSTSVAVIPAADGLSALARRATRHSDALHSLLPYFHHYALLVLHAPAHTLGVLLAETHSQPLVMVEPHAQGLLSSYQAIKYLDFYLNSGCTAAVVQHGAEGAAPAHDSMHALQQCAARHLSQPLVCSVLDAGSTGELKRLALQLLENAETMLSAEMAQTSSLRSAPTAQLVRSL